MSIKKTKESQTLLGYKLKQTQHALRIRMDEALRPLNITTPQYAVLSQLQQRPGISNAALARTSFITPQSMHGIITNLTKNNLIKREQDPKHGRIISTKLTTKGLNLVNKAHTIIANVEANMTSTISQKNLKLISQLLSECFNNLNSEA